MTRKEGFEAAKAALQDVTDDPAFEAVCLLEHFCGAGRTEILLRGGEKIEPAAEKELLSALERRKAGEPLQYILGEWDFMALTLSCGEGVLIPREDTAVLVEAVCRRLKKRDVAPVGLDLCAGTGAVGLMIAKETGAKVTAAELYDGAFLYLRKNLERYPALSVSAVRGDVLDKSFAETLPDGLDFIASNPPYIETGELPLLQREVQKEPKTALDGGADGLIFYRAICGFWAKKLRQDGVLAVEIGETQGEAVRALFEAAGLRDVQIHKDLGGLDRAVSGIR